jgi:ribonucleoside-triphosphate reductase
MTLVRKTLENTQAAQITISPEFTICNDCRKWTPRLQDHCDYCNSHDVYGVSRIVGYFSRISNWNKSKLGELKDRHHGNYSVAGSFPAAPPAPAPAAPSVELGTAAG